MFDSTPDEFVIKHVLQGKIDQFRIIVERYQDKIFSIGMRFFKNRDDAGDFTQDVLIKAYENLATYQGKAPFRYWITRVAWNLGINRLKKEKPEANVDEIPLRDRADSPEGSQASRDIREILLAAIEGLPENYRVCLDLYFFWGFKYEEIQKITDIPVNTIKSHVLRAKQCLRDSLRGTIAEDYHEMR